MEIFILAALALIALFTVMGFKVGLVRRILEFAGLVGSFLLATNLAPRFLGILVDKAHLAEKPALYVTWVVLFLVGLVLTRLAARAISQALQISILGWVDRLGGALFGLLIGTILASVVVIAISQVPGGNAIRDGFCEQSYSRAIYQAAPWLLDNFRRLGGDQQQVWDKIVREARKHAQVAVPDPPPLADDRK